MSETVLVKGWAKDGSHDSGVIMNKADFDPAVHVLFNSPADPEDTGMEFLNRNAVDVIADIPALNDEELHAALVAEKKGKARKGVVEAIEAAMKAAE